MNKRLGLHGIGVWMRVVLCSLCLALSHGALASDLPLAAGSPIAGIGFDDRPLLLPVQRNFQMAMLTASGELGRTCGKMEAYGWRMEDSEQQRVNLIFNNTVDRLRAQGYVVEAKAPSSVSRDVTLFTADRQDKHVIFMWSAGEIGLVMVACETSPPLTLRAPQPAADKTLSVPTVGNAPEDPYKVPPRSRYVPRAEKVVDIDFSPVGAWAGRYTCMQGTMGATLTVQSMSGGHFNGVFRFYPTSKNPYVPSGEYHVSGEYEADTARILINPGSWIKRPKGYDNTIMIGSFDPAARTFSGFFQGISGCTSFEARATRETVAAQAKTEKKKAQKASKAKQASRKNKSKLSSHTLAEAKKEPKSKDIVDAAPTDAPKAEVAAPGVQPVAPPQDSVAVQPVGNTHEVRSLADVVAETATKAAADTSKAIDSAIKEGGSSMPEIPGIKVEVVHDDAPSTGPSDDASVSPKAGAVH